MNLWAHRLVLASVSPFLRTLLVDFERRGDDVITIYLPLIKGYHMKLVLDYIYGGAMYLCGAHMQYVIQVMEVLQLKCGVSVNKMVKAGEGSMDPEKQWIEIEHSTMHLKDYDSDQDIHKQDDELEDKVKGQNESEVERETDNNNTDAGAKSNASCNLDQPPSRDVKSVAKTEMKSPRTNGIDSDDDNDVVMVELDEDFAVERVEQQSSQENAVEVVGEQMAPSFR